MVQHLRLGLPVAKCLSVVPVEHPGGQGQHNQDGAGEHGTRTLPPEKEKVYYQGNGVPFTFPAFSSVNNPLSYLLDQGLFNVAVVVVVVSVMESGENAAALLMCDSTSGGRLDEAGSDIGGWREEEDEVLRLREEGDREEVE